MPCRDTMNYITMTTGGSLTWQLGDFRSHNRTVLSSDPVRNVSLTGDICSATTLCNVMFDDVIMMSSVVYQITANTVHKMKASKYYLASIFTTSTTSVAHDQPSPYIDQKLQCNITDNYQVNAWSTSR